MKITLRHLDAIYIPFAISIISIGIAFSGSHTAQLLQYQPNFDQTGEVWRLLTAHFVHLNWSHLALNLVGLWLVWSLVGRALNPHQWLFVFVLLGLSITFSLRILTPTISWYVGLSGVLYGIFSTGIVASEKRIFTFRNFMLLLIIFKTSLEQIIGPISLIESSDHRVIVEAHLYGIVFGCGFGFFARVFPHWNGNAYNASDRLDNHRKY